MSFPEEKQLDERDGRYLRKAIVWSHAARRRGNRPFGAVVVSAAGEVLAEAYCNSAETGDCTGHAETNLMRLASRRFSPEQLASCTLYTSTEPCAMCSGAIYWSGIGRVVYALGSETLTAMLQDVGETSTLALSCREVFAQGTRTIDVSGPHLMEEAMAVHEGIWD